MNENKFMEQYCKNRFVLDELLRRELHKLMKDEKTLDGWINYIYITTETDNDVFNEAIDILLDDVAEIMYRGSLERMNEVAAYAVGLMKEDKFAKKHLIRRMFFDKCVKWENENPKLYMDLKLYCIMIRSIRDKKTPVNSNLLCEFLYDFEEYKTKLKQKRIQDSSR